jgi:hypothetical protein
MLVPALTIHHKRSQHEISCLLDNLYRNIATGFLKASFFFTKPCLVAQKLMAGGADSNILKHKFIS